MAGAQEVSNVAHRCACEQCDGTWLNAQKGSCGGIEGRDTLISEVAVSSGVGAEGEDLGEVKISHASTVGARGLLAHVWIGWP